MKKLLTLLTALTLLLSLTACGGGGNELFAEASPDSSVMSFYYFDGSAGYSDWISDTDKEREILAELSRVNAKPVDGWTPDSVTYPMYGVAIGTGDGMGLSMLWTNGYLITRTGEVYKFDYDFAATMDSLEWGNEWTREPGMDSRNSIGDVSAMPNDRYLALYDGQWNADYLRPADELEPPADISMSLDSWTAESVSVTIKNETSVEWCYGEYFHLEVLLDGAWYHVPVCPDENWGFTDIAIILQPYDENTETYSLDMYGQLPAGSYRLVVEGLSVEFDIG